MRSTDFLIIFILSISLATTNGTQSGSYRSILQDVQKCNTTTKPMADPPAITLHVEIYNTSTKYGLLRGNVTINRDEVCKGVKLKNYVWQKNKWKMTHVFNTVGCNGVLFPLAAMWIGIKYNRKTCQISKGTFSFSEVDNDKAQHLWMKAQDSGRHMWTLEAFTHNATSLCLVTHYIVEPLD